MKLLATTQEFNWVPQQPQLEFRFLSGCPLLFGYVRRFSTKWLLPITQVCKADRVNCNIHLFLRFVVDSSPAVARWWKVQKHCTVINGWTWASLRVIPPLSWENNDDPQMYVFDCYNFHFFLSCLIGTGRNASFEAFSTIDASTHFTSN